MWSFLLRVTMQAKETLKNTACASLLFAKRKIMSPVFLVTPSRWSISCANQKSLKSTSIDIGCLAPYVTLRCDLFGQQCHHARPSRNFGSHASFLHGAVGKPLEPSPVWGSGCTSSR